jgi:membrane protease YdiL (CAAX protease family)
VLFPLLALGFGVRLELSTLDAVYLAALLGLLPALAVAQVPLARNAPVDRLSAYAGSAGLLALLSVGALALGWDEPGIQGLGLGPVGTGTFVVWTLGLLAVAAVLQATFLGLSRLFGWKESKLLLELLPRTGEEKRAFAAVSVLAGFGEEIAFRGYAIPVLSPLLGGPWFAAVFTSATFGLLHAYQGPLGIVRTALFGLALAAAFILSGSLWPAVLAHFLLDLVVGVWLAERWTPETVREDAPHSQEPRG